jgi:hypothetical protein
MINQQKYVGSSSSYRLFIMATLVLIFSISFIWYRVILLEKLVLSDGLAICQELGRTSKSNLRLVLNQKEPEKVEKAEKAEKVEKSRKIGKK